MSLPPKQQLNKELTVIASAILHDIIGPTVGIEGCIKVDYWLGDFDIWTNGNEDANEEIRMKIADKYGLNENQMEYIDSYTSLMQIALFIYLADSA